MYIWNWDSSDIFFFKIQNINMSHLENWEYLWYYLTFCIVILDYGLKLHKLSIHTLVILQKWLEIY